MSSYFDIRIVHAQYLLLCINILDDSIMDVSTTLKLKKLSNSSICMQDIVHLSGFSGNADMSIIKSLLRFSFAVDSCKYLGKIISSIRVDFTISSKGVLSIVILSEKIFFIWRASLYFPER